ncbi:MAG TPA: hypothetical protein VGO13_07610 [Solirubrobacterales bacterium]|jgi:hypothetical protein|nr:hypothetical protein [Solirubrobacterales bacterium]
MSRPSAIESKHRGLLLGILILTLVTLLLGPGRAAAEAGEEDTGPVVSNARVSPSTLTYQGGSVAIDADVTDDFGITMVYAEVFGSSGIWESVQLIPSAINPAGVTTYSGTLNLPPNYTDAPLSYGIEIQATDTNGALATAFAGEIEVAEQPQFDEAPFVSNPTVTPRQLTALGGPVKIRATATDNRSISFVHANVTMPGGGTTQIDMEPVNASEFEGVFDVPGNADASAKQYAIEIVAEDDIGQPGTADAGIVTVAPPLLPPAGGPLTVSPASHSFGRVRLGHRAVRLIAVRNSGARGTPPVEGVIQASGAPFSLPRAGTDGIHFRLRPGHTRAYVVSFRPTTVGAQAGSISITRADGAQPGLSTQLSGEGVKRR